MAKNWERNLQRELKNAAFKEFEGWSTQELLTYILELREEITELKEESATDKAGKPPKQPLDEKKFNSEWSYPTKIHFLLELHQKPLTSTDLDTLLLKIDSHYRLYKQPKNNLTTSISRAVKSGRIKKIKEPGIKLKYYALPGWFEQNGQLKYDYRKELNPFKELF